MMEVKVRNQGLILFPRMSLPIIGIEFLVREMKNKPIKPVKLINPLNQEEWMCKNYNLTQDVDGVQYVVVYKPEIESRKVLMRKDALRKVN